MGQTFLVQVYFKIFTGQRREVLPFLSGNFALTIQIEAVGNQQEYGEADAGNGACSCGNPESLRGQQIGRCGHTGQHLLRNTGTQDTSGNQRAGNIADLKEGTGQRIHGEDDDKHVDPAENQDP